MRLNLGDVSDDEEEDNKITPNTKRDQMGVNSPREKHQVIIIYNTIVFNMYILHKFQITEIPRTK